MRFALSATAFALLLLTAACSAPRIPDEPPEPVATEFSATLTAEYKAMWWSEDQMDGLNPDEPPPKELEITLSKWDSSDPIGTPNPDTVDLLVTIKNDSPIAATGLLLEANMRLSVGSLDGNREKSSWGNAKALPPKKFDLAANTQVEQRFKNINLKNMWMPLFEQRRWPFEMETTLTLKDGDKEVGLVTAHMELMPGD